MSALQTFCPPEQTQPAKSRRMYPVCAGLEYRILDARLAHTRGHGHTVFLSSSRIVFKSEIALRAGLQIELAVDWPVRLDEKVELRLCLRGRTANVAGSYTTVLVSRYEFRTRAPGGARIGSGLCQAMAAARV